MTLFPDDRGCPICERDRREGTRTFHGCVSPEPRKQFEPSPAFFGGGDGGRSDGGRSIRFYAAVLATQKSIQAAIDAAPEDGHTFRCGTTDQCCQWADDLRLAIADYMGVKP